MAMPTRPEREEVIDLSQTSDKFREMKNLTNEKLERNLAREFNISSVSRISSNSNMHMKKAEGFKSQDLDLLTSCLNGSCNVQEL